MTEAHSEPPMSMEPAPFWWQAAPLHAIEPQQPATAIDVVVVGSGITGLITALRLAKAGRQVAVFDAAEIGAGASSHNAGFIGRTSKHASATCCAAMVPKGPSQSTASSTKPSMRDQDGSLRCLTSAPA